jgi:hypothetical protein
VEEPITRAKDLADVRMQAPDLAVGEKFIEDFGLIISDRTPDTLLYVPREGPAQHLSLGG